MLGVARREQRVELGKRGIDHHVEVPAGDTSAAALRPYHRAHRIAFRDGERLQHVVEAFVSRPGLLRWAAGRFTRRPALGDAVIHATGDVRPARSLLRPGLVAQLVI